MVDLVKQARVDLAQIADRQGRILLAFSGGKESALLAELCRPYRDRVSLLWVNTGFNFPHVETFIRDHGAAFDLIELRSDLMADWRANGLPAEILPVRNSLPMGCHTGERLQSYLGCCSTNRHQPAFDYISALPAPVTVLHGQRIEDGAPQNGMSGWPFPSSVRVEAVLADWQEIDVFAAIEAHGVRLPAHYPAVVDSLDCWTCPALLSRTAPQRLAYMAQTYPAELATLLPIARRIRDAGAEAMARLNAVLDHAPAVEASADGC